MQECAMLAFMDVTIKYTCSKHNRGYAPQTNGYEGKHIIINVNKKDGGCEWVGRGMNNGMKITLRSGKHVNNIKATSMYKCHTVRSRRLKA